VLASAAHDRGSDEDNDECREKGRSGCDEIRHELTRGAAVADRQAIEARMAGYIDVVMNAAIWIVERDAGALNLRA
jgi:hypothetical protein